MTEAKYLLDAAYEYGRGWGRYDYSHGHVHFAGTAGYIGERLDAYRAGYEAGWLELEAREQRGWKQILTGQEP